MTNPQKDAVGVVIELTVVDQDGQAPNLLPATETKIVFERPDGTTFEKDGIYANNGTIATLSYTTVADDLNQSGVWQLQAKVSFTGGFIGKSSKIVMPVERNAGE